MLSSDFLQLKKIDQSLCNRSIIVSHQYLQVSSLHPLDVKQQAG